MMGLMGRWFFLLAIWPCFAANSSLSALYATLDPLSVAEHFAFYELYPGSQEGKKALSHAWHLLSGGSKDEPVILPSCSLQPIIELVNRTEIDPIPLNTDALACIEKLSKNLANRKLKGFYLWDQKALLELDPEDIDLGRALLVAEMGDAKEKILNYEAMMDLMALQIKARLKPNATPFEKIRAMNDFVFSEMRFRFPPHSLYAKDIDVYTFLPSVLDSRRGVCLGVSILYLCLAQRLDLSLQAITPPGHIYVRYVEEGKEINIETTARGIDIPTEQYLGLQQRLDARSIKDCVGLAFMNQAAVFWHKNDSKTAIELYEKAKLFLKEDPLLNLFLGFNYLMIGKKKEGVELLKKNCERAPIELRAIAEDYLAKKVDIDGISAVFDEVDEKRTSILDKQKRLMETVEKFPQFRGGLFHLSVTWLQLGREKEAIPYLEKYAEMCPNDPTAHYYLAAIHFERHNYKKAWKFLKKAEKIVTTSPKALINLRREMQRKCPDKETEAI